MLLNLCNVKFTRRNLCKTHSVLHSGPKAEVKANQGSVRFWQC